MARIRSIKPEFWTSAQVLECSTNARLLFIGLWNFADDAGRHPFNAKQAKAEVFPADDFTLSDIQGMLDELSENGLITKYVVDGKEYLQVNGWRHQRIDKPQSPKHPGPEQEDSKNIPGTLPPDRIGRDKKDIKGGSGDPPYPEDFESVWSAYPKRSGDNPKRGAFKCWSARLKEGHTADEMRGGVERYTEFCRVSGKLESELVMQAKRFFGPDKPFTQPWEYTPKGATDFGSAGQIPAGEYF